jgi:RNA polymerase sigma-70 factor (ECF subfamily)
MRFLSAYTDAKLFSLVKKGDKEAFDCIYRKYWPVLLDEAFRRLKSREESEEIVQELFIYLWVNRERIQLTHSFSTYISTALKYRVFNHIRRSVVEEKHLTHMVKNGSHSTEMVEESVLYNELQSAYEKEIKNLPERCRIVYQLRREEDLSFKEIADRLDISVNTVDKQLGKALKRLREKLKEYHSSLPFFSFIAVTGFFLMVAQYVF